MYQITTYQQQEKTQLQQIRMKNNQIVFSLVQTDKMQPQNVLPYSLKVIEHNIDESNTDANEKLLEEQSPQMYRSSQMKQNKDSSNAARTARITLMSMILKQGKREIVAILQKLKQNSQIKKLMLNIGEKEFKERFLLKPQFKDYFSLIFNNINDEQIEKLMRKNKRSHLDYKARLKLCSQHINKYRQMYQQKFKRNTFFVSIPLKPQEYVKYMQQKGIYKKIL